MSKNMAQSISSDEVVHVFANELSGEPNRYEEDGVIVHRCWSSGILFPIKLILEVRSTTDLDTIHVHHEYEGIYGGPLSNLSFILFLLYLRIASFTSIVQPHGIIFDPEVIDNKSVDSFIANLPSIIVEILLLVFNQSIILLSNKVVVPNTVLKDKMKRECYVGDNSLFVVPHGVEKPKRKRREHAEKEDLTILYFGYMTWRKGPDRIAKAATSMPDNWSIILAGGKVPYLSESDKYNRYYNEIRSISMEKENIELTGFVDENDIDDHFLAADVLVLPYRKLLAASGVLALGLKYSVPFVLSEDISQILESNDIDRTIDNLEINKELLVFSTQDQTNGLQQTISSLCEDPEKYKSASKLSAKIAELRSWENLRDTYEDLYNSNT